MVAVINGPIGDAPCHAPMGAVGGVSRAPDRGRHATIGLERAAIYRFVVDDIDLLTLSPTLVLFTTQ